MKSSMFKSVGQRSNASLSYFLTLAAVIAFFIAPEALAQDPFGGTGDKVCGFFDNINGLLNLASIAVVTIAVIFAGYQIAFAHKRIADVAPILIGGLLIGAATQIAKMLIGDTGESCTTAMLMNILPTVYA
jgi:type IV secretion system protein VirB2